VIPRALTALLLLFPFTATCQTQDQIRLDKTAALEDIDTFETGMRERWSYFRANGVDPTAPLQALRQQASNGISVQDLGLGILKIIALFRDGHADVSNLEYPQGFLPFDEDVVAGRIVALSADRTNFLDKDHPYLSELDGIPLAQWLEASDRFTPHGSPQFRLDRSAWQLRFITLLRRELNLPEKATVEVELTNEQGSDRKKITVPLATDIPDHLVWPMHDSELHPGNIGYLRIWAMRPWMPELIAYWMRFFRNTKGLIVDVRANSGGTRDATLALFPYLMAPGDDEPWVVNVAALRKSSGTSSEELSKTRGMYPAESEHWNDAERRAIKQFMATWKPQWTPPEGEFGEWHFLVLDRRLNPSAYAYDKPVVILTDFRDFSGTDIFVSAFKGRRNVTLIGTPTAGASAFKRELSLPNSHLVVHLASMISYKRDGKLYDGNGTQPDIHIERTPESLLRFGEDNQLRKAIEVLGKH